jgi:outer membrane protein assembly factor BamA
MTGGLGLLRAEAGLLFDTTVENLSGTRILLSAWYADELDGDRFGFTGLSAELEQEVHLAYGRYIVFRAATASVRATRGRIVPFYELSALGGLETLRGYPWGRFRDRGMLGGSIEYYYPIWAHGERSLETFLFSDAGQVADVLFSGLSLDRTKLSFGVGAVLVGLEGEWIRGTIGWSREGFEFYLSWN